MRGLAGRDPVHSDPVRKNISYVVFADSNGLLGEHPIVRGRSDEERVRVVETFGGPYAAQDIGLPEGAVNLLRLGGSAQAAAVYMHTDLRAQGGTTSIQGGSLGVGMRPPGGSEGGAFELGQGRVIVLGDAAMLTAIVRANANGQEDRVGISAKGIDNQQFALNVVHWLSRLF
jgi:hypothetical protein